MGTIALAQFDETTKDVLYDEGAADAIVWQTTCEWCDVVPKFIDVTFSNLVDGGCIECESGVGNSMNLTGVAAYLNGTTWRVRLSTGCAYRWGFEPGHFGNVDYHYGVIDCSGEPGLTWDYWILIFYIDLLETGVRARITVYGGGDYQTLVPSETFTYGEGESCGNVAGATFVATPTCFVPGSVYRNIVKGGTIDFDAVL